MLVQVTFVFTNQVDGKLVPIESKVRANTRGVEVNENQSDKRRKLLQKPMLPFKHQRSVPLASNKGDSITTTISSSSSSNPSQLAGTTNLRTLKATPSVTLKPNLSLGRQLPSKRLSHDDDFE